MRFPSHQTPWHSDSHRVEETWHQSDWTHDPSIEHPRSSKNEDGQPHIEIQQLYSNDNVIISEINKEFWYLQTLQTFKVYIKFFFRNGSAESYLDD